MNKKISVGAALAMWILSVALTIVITMQVAMWRFDVMVKDMQDRALMFDYLSEVDSAARGHYAGAIDAAKLRTALAHGYIDGLDDPYAAFYTPAEYARILDDLAGSGTGYGLTVALNQRGEVTVTEVQRDSTAYSAGLLRGDVITAIEGVSFGSRPLSAVQDTLENAPSMLLTFSRGGAAGTSVELSASKFTVETVEARSLEAFGYIRIKSFNALTAEQFRSAYKQQLEAGMNGLILDLRGNPGGSGDAAKALTAYLLPRGRYAYSKTKDAVTELKAEDAYQMDIPCAVLVDENTAGEAELMAMALAQSGGATLVGRPTAGRAQEVAYFPLTSDNAAVALSVALWSPVTGESWQDVGLTPAVDVELSALAAATPLSLLELGNDAQLLAAVARLESGLPPLPPEEPTTTDTEPATSETTPEEDATSSEEGETTDAAGTE